MLFTHLFGIFCHDVKPGNSNFLETLSKIDNFTLFKKSLEIL